MRGWGVKPLSSRGPAPSREGLGSNTCQKGEEAGPPSREATLVKEGAGSKSRRVWGGATLVRRVVKGWGATHVRRSQGQGLPGSQLQGQ